jgi:hypothetical protein
MSDFLVKIEADSLAHVMRDWQYHRDRYDTVVHDAEKASEEWEKARDEERAKYRSVRNALLLLLNLPEDSVMDDAGLLQLVAERMGGESTGLHPVEDPAEHGAYGSVQVMAALPAQGWSSSGGVVEPVGEPFVPFRLEQQHEVQDTGPNTETMRPVDKPDMFEEFEEPPAPAGVRLLGRVFVRDQGQELPDETQLLINRSGDVYHRIPTDYDATPVFECEDLRTRHGFPELLHMHGVLWEAVPVPAVQEGAEQ